MIASWGLKLIERSYLEAAERGTGPMCGIAGLIDPSLAAQPEALERSARDIANAIAHREPDGEGGGLMAPKRRGPGRRPGVVRSLAPQGVACYLVVSTGFESAAWSRFCRPVILPTMNGEALIEGLLRLRRHGTTTRSCPARTRLPP